MIREPLREPLPELDAVCDPADVQRVGVVGAGTMGAGIAQVFLGAGCSVVLQDVSVQQRTLAGERVLDGLRRWQAKGNLADAETAFTRLELSHSLVRLQPCQWVIEAVVEDRVVKADLFRALGRLCHRDAILATNTSSISLTYLGSESGRPERTVGLHFFNPAPVMRLVEVVGGLRTHPSVMDAACGLVERLQKVPITSRDRPGFLTNRILMPMLNEAFYALEEGVGSVEDIDCAMRLGMNHPMGPLELADLIGLDVCLAILEVLHGELGDPKFRPCPLLRKHVEAGWLGKKTRRGFYAYND